MEKISNEMKTALREDVGKIMKYRAALGKEDKQVLDKLLSLAKNYAPACANAKKMNLMESMLLAILIEQQKTIERLTIPQQSMAPERIRMRSKIEPKESNTVGSQINLAANSGNQELENKNIFSFPTLKETEFLSPVAGNWTLRNEVPCAQCSIEH